MPPREGEDIRIAISYMPRLIERTHADPPDPLVRARRPPRRVGEFAPAALKTSMPSSFHLHFDHLDLRSCKLAAHVYRRPRGAGLVVAQGIHVVSRALGR